MMVDLVLVDFMLLLIGDHLKLDDAVEYTIEDCFG
jgi:hypothetical protein